MNFPAKKFLFLALMAVAISADLRASDPCAGASEVDKSNCATMVTVLGAVTVAGLTVAIQNLWQYFQSSSFSAYDLYKAAKNAFDSMPEGFKPADVQNAVMTAVEQYLVQSAATSKGAMDYTITVEQLAEYLDANYPQNGYADRTQITLAQLQDLSTDFIIDTSNTSIGKSTNWSDYLPSSASGIKPGEFFVASGISVSTYKVFYKQFDLLKAVPLQSTPDDVMEFITQWRNTNNYSGYGANQKALTDIVTAITDFNSIDISQSKTAYALPEYNITYDAQGNATGQEPIDPPYKDLIDYFNRNKIYTPQAAQDLFQITNSRGNDGLLPGVYTSPSSGPGKGGDVPPTNNDPGQPGNGDLGNFDELVNNTIYYKEYVYKTVTDDQWEEVYKSFSPSQALAMAKDLILIGQDINSTDATQVDESQYTNAREAFEKQYGVTPEKYVSANEVVGG
jgi:hypothetical protein